MTNLFTARLSAADKGIAFSSDFVKIGISISILIFIGLLFIGM